MTLTVRDYLERSGAGDSSIDTYRKLLTRCERMMGRPLGEATARDVAGLKTELRKMRSGANYIRRVKAFYRAAGRQDLADLCALKQRVKRLGPDDILTLPEVNRMLEAADSLRDRALIATLWATGQRVGAVCALRLGDLKDLTRGDGGSALRVFFRTVKVAGEEHVSWILDTDGGDHVRAWVRAYPYERTENAPLFPSYRFAPTSVPNSLTESGALKVIVSTARRAKMGKRVWPHLFRHSRATHLLRLGMDASSVKKLCGWSPGSPVMERTYSHLVDHDAYVSLLRAHGLPAPETVDMGKLVAAEGGLKPVVPMAAPPGGRMELREPDVPEVERMLDQPEFQEAVRRLVLEFASRGASP